MKLKTIYKRFKAWWRMRQYVKELKSNKEPFRWGSHKKEYNKPLSELAHIETLVSCMRDRKPDAEI